MNGNSPHKGGTLKVPGFGSQQQQVIYLGSDAALYLGKAVAPNELTTEPPRHMFNMGAGSLLVVLPPDQVEKARAAGLITIGEQPPPAPGAGLVS